MAVTPEKLISCLMTDLSVNNLPLLDDLYPGINLAQVFGISIKASLVKKFISKVAADADQKALNKFLACNSACEAWSPEPHKWDSRIETLIGTVRQCLSEFWFTSATSGLVDHPYQILDEGRVGPGANLSARGGSSYAKLFASPLTCSDPSLYVWYSRYIRGFPEWANAELIRKANYGEAVVTKNSRLSFVPKNDEISRCICTEPTLNTYFQLGFGALLERRLRERYGISLRTQPDLNRELARLGSKEDSVVTIDLASASDSISRNMVKYMFPAEWHIQLEKYRTPLVEIKGVGTVPLSMISTMGNGFTFPLQTVLFACVVDACYRFRGVKTPRGGCTSNSWGVFGDDIICPKFILRDVMDLLTFLGFKVNVDKTFVEGPFRESCGADFFNGVNVRGVYVKETKTPASLYAAINQLTRFSTRSGIQLHSTLGCLFDQIKEPLFVPVWEDFSAGIHSYSPRSVRWNKHKQMYSYNCLVARNPSYRILEEEIVVPYGAKRLIYNPSGLLMSFLLREVNAATIGFRPESVIWRRKRRYTSNWRIPPRPEGVPYGDRNMDWPRLDAVVDAFLETRNI
jgi:hypothetical protein